MATEPGLNRDSESVFLFSTVWSGRPADCPFSTGPSALPGQRELRARVALAYAETIFDASFAYDFAMRGGTRLRLHITVNNLFDEDPRVVGATPDNNALITTNTGRYDPLGRRGFVALQVDF